MKEIDEEWLADYLRLEYGEDENDPDSVKAEHLVYEGQYLIKGIKTKYWKYPTSDGFSWVVIEEYENSRCANFSETPPPEKASST